MSQRMYCFVGGASGPWRVTEARAIAGEALARPVRLDVLDEAPTGRDVD